MYALRELERRNLETTNRWRNNLKLIATLGATFRFINLTCCANSISIY